MSTVTAINPENDLLFEEYLEGFFGNDDPNQDPELREITKGSKPFPELE